MPQGGARELLRRLHGMMASRTPTQAKLDLVARMIAEALSSEVASIYLVRDTTLELAATYGLRQQAVHVTRLSIGQGLVGTIAETRAALNLAHASEHPRYVYRPETGEEIYHSFAGVPIIRRERVAGVLAVQSRQQDGYDDVEIEALQTVAMVLAELIAAAGLIDIGTGTARASNDIAPAQLRGMRIVDGIAEGVAVFHEPRVVITRSVADDPETEHARLRNALHQMREDIDQMVSRTEFAGPGEHDGILETYRMFALDAGWARRIHDSIDGGLTAEAAIEAVAQAQRISLGSASDPYLRERIHDLEDLSNRLIRIVTGAGTTAAKQGLSSDTILIARNLGPAELLEYDRSRLKGVALEEGSLTAHVTILARAMGIALLGQVKGLRQQVNDGDPLLLDGNNGLLFIRPTPTVAAGYQAQMALHARRQAEYDRLRDQPAVSRDNCRISLMMNAALRSDLGALDITNADGIGLFRTEFQFLVSATLPRIGPQIDLYRKVLAAAGERPVTFRTVDIGGDKSVPYIGTDGMREENPAMGWRALRLAMSRPGLMAAQARALLEAAAGKTLRLMFPMVAEPWEYEQARAIVEERKAKLAAMGVPHATDILYGTMLEVPALAMVLDELLPRLDFLSIGTNDLTQFLLAADRGNPHLANRYDWLSRSVLRFIRTIVENCDAHGVPVSVCGEMGGRRLEALALLALGVRRLSITPAAIGPVKAMIRSADIGDVSQQMQQWLDTPGTDIRERLTDYVTQHEIVID